jgi:hypothetical protein
MLVKNVFRTLSACLVLLGLITTASAQSGTMLVTIPFDFRVGNTVLSRGDYTVRLTANGQVVQMISNDGKQSAVSMANAAYIPTSPTRTSLVFSRYGDVLFLSEILWEGNRTSRQLLKSAAELEIAKTTRGVRIVAGGR